MPFPYPSSVGEFIGAHKLDLPSPSLCISLPVVKENARRLHEAILAAKVGFRAHTKTNKTDEITKIMLGEISTKVAISTLQEAHSMQALIDNGAITDILYAIPICPSVIPSLDKLSAKVSVHVFVDHVDHVALLSQYNRSAETRKQPWSVFIKIDLGSKRAGLPLDSDRLQKLVTAVENSRSLKLHGFYSYPARNTTRWDTEVAVSTLRTHVSLLVKASRLLSKPPSSLVLAIGSSITARVIDRLPINLPPGLKLEVVAGTAIYNDLQQLSTNTISSIDLAMTVVAEVCSVYEERNEVLTNAGVLAITREQGDLAGLAHVRDASRKGWVVSRVSQEHGILTYAGKESRSATEDFHIGDKVELDIQHTCIVGAMYGWHYITDQDGIVRDIYSPWKWW